MTAVRLTSPFPYIGRLSGGGPLPRKRRLFLLWAPLEICLFPVTIVFWYAVELTALEIGTPSLLFGQSAVWVIPGREAVQFPSDTLGQ